MGTIRSINAPFLCAAAALVFVPAVTRGAVAPPDEIPLANGQRLIVGQIGDASILSIKAAPALNAAG